MNPRDQHGGHGTPERDISSGQRLVGAVFGDRYIPGPLKLVVAIGVLSALTYVLLSSNPWSIFKFVPYTLRPDSSLETRIPDKVFHFTGYFGLSLVFMWYAAARSRWLLLALIGLMVGHAAVTEVLQGYVPDRTTDWTDFIANSLGITLGTCIGLYCRRFVEREDNELVLWAGVNPIIPASEIRTNAEPTAQGGMAGLGARQVQPVNVVGTGGSSINATIANEGGSRRNLNLRATGIVRDDRAEKAIADAQTRIINYRFLGRCVVALAVVFGGSYFVHGWQVQRNAGLLLKYGQEAREAGDLVKARDFYARYVSLVPTNKSVMAEYGVLIDETRKGIRGAGHVFNIFEDLLRVDPSREDIRRRQVKLAVQMGRFNDALAHLRVLRQSHPSEGALDVQAAECEEQLGDFAAAAETYHAAIGRSPNLVDAYRKAALLLHLKLDRREEAAALLDQLVSINEDKAASWIARSEFRREIGKYQTAAEDMQQAINVAPHDLAVLSAAGDLGYSRAQAARGEGRQAEVERVVTETLTTLTQGLEHHPENLELMLRIILLQSHFGDATAAFDDLAKIAMEHPKDPRVHMMLADVSIERGDFDRAREAIEKLPRTPQADGLRLFLRGRIEHAEKKYDIAVSTLEQARRYLSDSPTLTERADLAIAMCYRALDQVEGELDAFRRIVKENPTSLVGRLGLANCFAKSGRLSDAIVEYGQLKHMPQVRLLLARVLILKNLKLAELDRDWREVEVLLDDARKHGDHPAQETLLRVEMLAGKGLFEDARQLLEQARASQVDRLEFLMALHQIADRSGDERLAALWLGQAQEADGNLEKAEATLKKAVELSGSDPAARQTLMHFYLRQQRPNDAMDVFKSVASKLDRRELAKGYAAFGDLGRAVGLLQQELKDRPDAVVPLQTLADIYLSHGLEQRAEPLLRKILAQTASLPESTVKRTRRQLAVLLSKRGDAAAQDEARTLLSSNSDVANATPDDLRAQAAMLASSRLIDDRRQAQSILESLDDRELLLPNDRWLLARLYEDLGNSAQAARHLEQLLVVGSNNSTYLRDYVRYQIEHQAFEAAGKWLDRLQKLVPEDFEGAVLRARWQAGRDDHDNAQSALRKLATTATGKTRNARLLDLVQACDAIVKTQRDAALKTSYAQLADELHQLALATDPQHVQQYVEWLGQQGRMTEAFQQLDSVWKLLPPEVAAGVTLSLVGNATNAAEHFEAIEARLTKALDKSPKSGLIKVCLADLRSLRGDQDAAETLYREVLEGDRRHVPALNNLAWNLATRGKMTDEAMLLIERAIAIAGPAPQLLDTRACVFLSQHNAARALKDLKRVLVEEPTATAHFHLALVHAETGETDAARDSLKTATLRGFKPQHPLERDQLTALQQKLRNR